MELEQTDHLLRKRQLNNTTIFLNSDYDVAALADGRDNLVFTRNAIGAEKLRYSVDFGKNWAEWRDCEDTTSIPKSAFRDKKFF